MDREETRLRRSPFALREPQLQKYVQDIACRLAADHCPDLRVYLVRNPFFNANMAPNGMMQVWTGLLLRMENEAQLAAVVAHEIGHYLERHSIERLRDVKSRTAFMQFLGAFGLVGAVGQLIMFAGAVAYSRDQERTADRIGADLMRKAGYDVGEAAKVWDNLLLEIKASESDDGSRESPLFASHPAPEDRREALDQLAKTSPGGEKHEARWRERMKPHLLEWLGEEIKRGQHAQSIALLTRMVQKLPAQPEFPYARGEILRLRGANGDLDAALNDYFAAARVGGEPAETHRGIGLIYRSRRQMPEAKASFEHYLKLAPNAPDSLLIRSYMEGPAT